MSMYDDLDPQFMSSPGAALPIVAARVWEIRKRRMVAIGSVCGAILIVMFSSVAFGGGGKPNRLTVARKVTTTTGESSTEAPLVTAPTTTATSSTTTLPASTTSTLPIVPKTTATSPKTTTTIPKPGHIVVTADRDRLVIQSGTKATVEYTLTNDGDEPARFAYSPRMCFPDFPVWPDHESRILPIAWPLPVDDHQYCASLAFVTVAPHASARLPITIVAGLRDQTATNVVPAPPGDTSFLLRNAVAGGGALRLPVTVTPPAAPPLTIDNPSEVTTASGAQNFVDFTITNHLPFAVRYTDQGPCSPDGDALCKATTPDGTFTGDLRKPPYATAVKPLYLTTFTLQANETRTVRAAVHGTTNLWDSGTGNSDLPPGIYYFDWDGEKVKFTVTP